MNKPNFVVVFSEDSKRFEESVNEHLNNGYELFNSGFIAVSTDNLGDSVVHWAHLKKNVKIQGQAQIKRLSGV